MKKTISIFLLCLTGIFSYGQAQETQPTNQTIIRLTVVKDNDKILMRNTKYGWMTPAVYFKEKQNIREVLDSMSGLYGIKISDPNLKGLFTYKYEFKTTADMRQLYVANYKSGSLKPSAEGEEVYWIPINEALDKLESTVPSLKQITKQIIEYPNTLWGGSFILYREHEKMKSRIEEDFYPLMNCIN